MTSASFVRWIALAAAAAAAVVALAAGALAQGSEDELHRFVAAALGRDMGEVVVAPDDGVGRPVRAGGATVAYVGSTWAIARTAGYSGRPVDILVVVDREAVIRGARLIAQEEPVLTLGISPDRIARFVDGFAGYSLVATAQPAAAPRAGLPDAIAGATISSGVIRSGIIRTARAMALHHGLLGTAAGGGLDMSFAEPSSWDELVAAGAVGRRFVAIAEADAALGTAAAGADPAKPFVDLHVAVLDPPRIGASLLGQAGYSDLAGTMAAGDHALAVAANGLYSFKGTAWRRTGVFERLELVQGERTVRLTRDSHRPATRFVAAGAPEFREIGLFVVPGEAGFDPARPFRLSLLASRDDAAGATRLARFDLDHRLPDTYLRAQAAPAADETPLWRENWSSRTLAIAFTVGLLLTLYLILIFQNQVAKRPRLYGAIRIGFLGLVVVVLGGIVGAQLSVVHVLTFLQAIRTEFSWQTFLLDPVIFIVWAWVAVALLFWGRVYCGWLCPFGALQELLNRAARLAGVRQIAIPFAVHERLWPLKYIAFLGLFAASLASMPLAFRGAEIEPFKTVVTMRFVREWPFVLYAAALLGAGLFVERLFCRYLCPLGAALAIPARLRMFEWLKRRHQCGRECRICSTQCPVQAIHPEGHINPNECVYCLHCQILYHDPHTCPPLKARAARRAAVTVYDTTGDAA